MTEAMKLLHQQGFSGLACQFATFIDRKEAGKSTVVSLTAGLLTEAMSQGHVCLNLANPPETIHQLNAFLPNNTADWQQQLREAKSVGKPGDYTPLILTENGLLYLYRFWRDEQDVAHAIMQRRHDVDNVNPVSYTHLTLPTNREV